MNRTSVWFQVPPLKGVSSGTTENIRVLLVPTGGGTSSDLRFREWNQGGTNRGETRNPLRDNVVPGFRAFWNQPRLAPLPAPIGTVSEELE